MMRLGSDGVIKLYLSLIDTRGVHIIAMLVDNTRKLFNYVCVEKYDDKFEFLRNWLYFTASTLQADQSYQ